MHQVTFPFNREKLAEALAFFASNGVTDLTKLKAAKLIYYLDKYHLWHHARPVVGGTYFCMPFGPVPGRALQAMNDVIDAAEIDGFGDMVLGERVKVDMGPKHPVFRPTSDGYDGSVFSRSELDALQHVLTEYGPETASRLVTLTHNDPTWTKPNEARQQPGGRVPIPYQLFFEDATAETRQIWQLIEAEQAALLDEDDYVPPTETTSEACV